ncbi:MAG TPA: DNA recombination/repair protein RecA, partial [Anaerolineaceae bacterium]|nr:DNA recombination/repair protein RecA [Anaerolineaceae bacterium]
MAKKATPKSKSTDGMEEAKKAVLDRALHDIVKRYGEGSIMRLGEAHQMKVEAIPTGSLSLDLALGV